MDGETFTPRTACARNAFRLPSWDVALPQFPAFGVGHVTAPGAEHALAVGLVLNSGNCSPSEDEAAEQSAAGSGEE